MIAAMRVRFNTTMRGVTPPRYNNDQTFYFWESIMALVLTAVKGVRLAHPTFFRQTDIDRLVRALKLRGELYGYTNPAASLIAYPEKFHLTDKKKASHYFSTFVTKEGYATATLHILDTPEGNALLKLIKADKVKQARRMFNDPWRFNGVSSNADGFFAIDFVNKR